MPLLDCKLCLAVQLVLSFNLALVLERCKLSNQARALYSALVRDHPSSVDCAKPLQPASQLIAHHACTACRLASTDIALSA